MNEQILALLKMRLDDLTAYGGVDAEVKRNVLKEELQYYLLNYIYHHEEYRDWVMYGGSALRICHDLNRMSVDLDFEIKYPCTDAHLSSLKEEIEQYFKENFGIGLDFLSIKITRGRGLLLKFLIGDELGITHPSKQVHVKIDLNHFMAPKTVTQRIPINHGQFSFVIVTYNMAALMASKIAAIFSRRERGVGKDVYQEKGRDIYDLLWYMEKKAVPDLDYLAAKGIDIKDLRSLFDRLTVKMNKVSDTNLRQDLTPLFTDQTYIKNWLANWRESFLRLVETYHIRVITRLREVSVREDEKGIFSFTYSYDTEDEKTAHVTYRLSEYWIEDHGLPMVKVNEAVARLLTGDIKERRRSQIERYATLLYDKTEAYYKKSNRVMLGEQITTKLMRTTAKDLDQNEQVLLSKSVLLTCELEDLLR